MLDSGCILHLPSSSELWALIIIPIAYVGRMVMEGGCPVGKAGIQILASISSAYVLFRAPPCSRVSFFLEGVWLPDALTALASAGKSKGETALPATRDLRAQNA